MLEQAQPGSNAAPQSITQFGGQRWPDIVGALHVKQGWGEAQVSGVIHNVNVFDNVYNGAPLTAEPGCGVTGTLDLQRSADTRSAGRSTPA